MPSNGARAAAALAGWKTAGGQGVPGTVGAAASAARAPPTGGAGHGWVSYVRVGRLSSRPDWSQRLTSVPSLLAVLVTAAAIAVTGYFTSQANGEQQRAKRARGRLLMRSDLQIRVARAIKEYRDA